MEIVAEFSQMKDIEDELTPEITRQEGPVYELLVCPSCEKVILLGGYYDEECDVLEEPPEMTVLYPQSERMPLGLSPTVKTAFEAALKVRRIDPNAYAVLLGRVLDKVCEDRKAQGKTLYERFQDLAMRGEIPQPLLEMAQRLRQLRNVGAHADLGELSSREVPFLDDLCRAILEYVYSGRELLARVRKGVRGLGSKSSDEESAG
jgi:hypothetical protein